MTRCPHCGRDAMSLGEKASLGPGRVVRCRQCGGGVTSHPAAILAALPAFLGGFAFLKADSVSMGMVAVLAGLAVMALVHTFAVPLTKA